MEKKVNKSQEPGGIPDGGSLNISGPTDADYSEVPRQGRVAASRFPDRAAQHKVSHQFDMVLAHLAENDLSGMRTGIAELRVMLDEHMKIDPVQLKNFSRYEISAILIYLAALAEGKADGSI